MVATGSNSALVTLDKESRAGGFAEVWEGATRRASGRVVRIDRSGMHVVADQLLSSNGLALSADRQWLYAGEWVGRSVAVFRADTEGEWLLERRVRMPFSVDNLTMRPDGKLIVAGHPRLFHLNRRLAQIDPERPISWISLRPVGFGCLSLRSCLKSNFQAAVWGHNAIFLL